MDLGLLDHQQEIYGATFYGSLVLFAVAEFFLPRLRTRHGVGARWCTNLCLTAASFVLGRLIIPIGTIAFSLYVQAKGWGLLHLSSTPLWLSIPVGVLLLDFSEYVQHRLVHAVPLLWRTHVVHHADLDVDFTTGFRHHPFEAMISFATAPITILLFGIGPLAVLIHQLLSAVSAIYTHANIRYPSAVDRLLRLVFVTRDVHAIHHSARRAETDSNYGQIFLFWDRLLGTYCPEPAEGQEEMTVGLEYFREPREMVIDRVLTMPFRVPRSGLVPAREARSQTAPPAA